MSTENEMPVSADIVLRHEKQADNMLSIATSCIIDSPEMAEIAAEELGSVVAAIKTLEAERTELKRPVLEAGRKIDDLFARLKERYLRAEAALKPALLAWQDSERKRVAAERRAAEEAAAKVAEEARQAAAALAAAAAQAAKAAEEDCNMEALEAAENLVVQAQIAEVEADSIAFMGAVPVEAPQKLAGISTRKDWDFEIINPALIPIEYMIVDEKKIRGVVKALKEQAKIPGVRVFSKDTMAVRAKK